MVRAWTLLAVLMAPPALAADPAWSAPLQDTAGASTTLAAEARDERLVVVVMKGAWCPVCVAQIERLAAASTRLSAHGTRLVALNADPPSHNASISATVGVPVLTDPGRVVLEERGLWRDNVAAPMPGLVLYDRCGTAAWQWNGRRPGIDVDPLLFAALEALDAEPESCDDAVSWR